MAQSYRDLKVWQRAIELVVAVYELTDQFPKEEQYGLVSQMRRAAVSIASNIAEGRYRHTQADFAHFLTMAFGSGGELETQIEVSKRLSKTIGLDYRKVDQLLNEVMRMLNKMIPAINDPSAGHQTNG